MWIVRLALRRPYTFVVVSLLIAILGVTAIITMPVDIFPDIVADHLQVRFNRRFAGSTELIYQYHSSPDLMSWSSLTGTEVSVTPSATLPGFEEGIFHVAPTVSNHPPFYMRLAAQLP